MCPSLAPILEESTRSAGRDTAQHVTRVCGATTAPALQSQFFITSLHVLCTWREGPGLVQLGLGWAWRLNLTTWGTWAQCANVFFCSFWKYEIFICSLKKIFTNKIAIVN